MVLNLELKRRSYGRLKTTVQSWTKMLQLHPISLLLDTFLEHLMVLKLCILYLVSNIGKSGVQSFKRCLIWRWNEEVMAIWRWLCKDERKCCSRTPFRYCWTHFLSTSWSSNYAYHFSFRSLGIQESSVSNGVRFRFETKKLWPFEDEPCTAKAKFFWFRSRTPISQPPNPISQLRNGLRKWHLAEKIPFGCEMFSQPHSYPLPNPPFATKMAVCCHMIFKLPNDYEMTSKL